MSIFGFTKESRDRRQRDANNTTMMLIVVIAVFLSVELPLSCITALHTISSRYSWTAVAASIWAFIFKFCWVSWLQTRQQHHSLHQRNYLLVISSKLRHLLWHVKVTIFFKTVMIDSWCYRQFRKTFRSLFIIPLQSSFCSSREVKDSGEQEQTDGITGNKSRWILFINKT